MYHVSAEGVDERMINVHYYYDDDEQGRNVLSQHLHEQGRNVWGKITNAS